MKLLILFCQLNNKLTIDLKQEIVKATLVKTLLDKIPSYLYSRTFLQFSKFVAHQRNMR